MPPQDKQTLMQVPTKVLRNIITSTGAEILKQVNPDAKTKGNIKLPEALLGFCFTFALSHISSQSRLLAFSRFSVRCCSLVLPICLISCVLVLVSIFAQVQHVMPKILFSHSNVKLSSGYGLLVIV
jgi:hypothetical protein